MWVWVDGGGCMAAIASICLCVFAFNLHHAAATTTAPCEKTGVGGRASARAMASNEWVNLAKIECSGVYSTHR